MQYSTTDNDYQTVNKIQLHETLLIERFTRVPARLQDYERRRYQTTSDMKKCDTCGEYKITSTFRFPDACDVMCWECWRNYALTKLDKYSLKSLLLELYEEHKDRDWRVNRFMWDISNRMDELEKDSSK